MLDLDRRGCNNYYMAKGRTMTELLRQALIETESFNAVERETGVLRQSLMKFARGEQSLRLDLADKLADYFDIECRQTPRKGKRNGKHSNGKER
jgi:hypothetical protein